MPNLNTPFGLKPIAHKSGAPYNGAATPYFVPASYATALFIGDPVVKTGTANTVAVERVGAGSWPIGSLPEINKATVGSTNRITGVIVGFAPITSTSLPYNPASTAAIVWVADDPDLVFEVQSDLSLAAVDVGLNANLIYTQSGSTSTGLSGVELDGGTTTAPATGATLQLNILRISPRLDNDAGQARVKVQVRINLHTETAGSAGI